MIRSLCSGLVAVMAVAALTCSAWAEGLAVKVTVAEPAGIERKAEPASGGIPFHPGQVRSVDELSLTDAAGKPVAAQFSRLAAYDDGSVQWALVDLLADVPANGQLDLVVRSGKAAAPARALEIRETDAAVTVNTGAATFTVNKAAFNLLDAVEIGGRKVAGPGSVDIVDGDGASFKAGKPSRVTWEYRGPIRATLRVDGDYLGQGGAKFISYTTRLTFWAGLAAVRVDHSVRNSNPQEGNDVKIKSASLSLGYKGAQAATGQGWVAAADGGSTLLVSHRHTGGCFPASKPAFEKVAAADGKVTAWVVPEGTGGKGIYGYGEGFFALADCAHKDSQVWYDFAVDAASAQKQHNAYHSWLHALADPVQVSETATLGFGKFGTLEDEGNTYRKWGWSGIDDAKKRSSTQKAHKPNANLDVLEVHFESEADSAELDLLMYVRTGQRGFLDEGEAYTRYFKTHYTFRSDGFAYDGWKHGHVSARITLKSTRKNKGATFDWYSPRQYGWSQSRWCPCHFWGAGLFDYYCLTGDVDALEAGIDCAEEAMMLTSLSKPGDLLHLSRAWGRNFMAVLRAYQVTRDEQWKKAVENFAEQVRKAPNRDKSGLYNAGVNSMMVNDYVATFFDDKNKKPAPQACRQYIKDHGITYKIDHGSRLYLTDKDGKTWEVWESPQSFEFAASVAAVARYAEIMDDKEMSKVVVGLADGAEKHYWSQNCLHHTPYYHHPHIGMPIADKVYDEADWSDAHKECATGTGARHSGYHTRYMAEVFAAAYTNSGDAKWLELAKQAWNRGTKRGYWTNSQSFPDDVLAAFAGHSAPKGDGIDIRSSYRLFFEVPRAK